MKVEQANKVVLGCSWMSKKMSQLDGGGEISLQIQSASNASGGKLEKSQQHFNNQGIGRVLDYTLAIELWVGIYPLTP